MRLLDERLPQHKLGGSFPLPLGVLARFVAEQLPSLLPPLYGDAQILDDVSHPPLRVQLCTSSRPRLS